MERNSIQCENGFHKIVKSYNFYQGVAVIKNDRFTTFCYLGAQHLWKHLIDGINP